MVEKLLKRPITVQWGMGKGPVDRNRLIHLISISKPISHRICFQFGHTSFTSVLTASRYQRPETIIKILLGLLNVSAWPSRLLLIYVFWKAHSTCSSCTGDAAIRGNVFLSVLSNPTLFFECDYFMEGAGPQSTCWIQMQSVLIVLRLPRNWKIFFYTLNLEKFCWDF